MDEYQRRQHVVDLMEHDERVRWTGASSATAYLGGHIPLVLFTGLFCAGVTGTAGGAIRALMVNEVTGRDAFQLIFMMITAWFVYVTLRGVIRDLRVDWVVTDRRIYRISGATVMQTDIRSAASIEVTRRDGERGSIIVSMPEMHHDDGDSYHPSVALLGIDHLTGAYAAITAAQTGTGRTI